MKKRLVVIPARGGSKRIKLKNLKKILNKPLIDYALDSAVKSKIFSKIHVSSDSEKILNHAKRFGIKNDFISIFMQLKVIDGLGTYCLSIKIQIKTQL